jgi:hypothetical protein
MCIEKWNLSTRSNARAFVLVLIKIVVTNKADKDVLRGGATLLRVTIRLHGHINCGNSITDSCEAAGGLRRNKRMENFRSRL